MLRYWKAYIHLVVGLKAGWTLESEHIFGRRWAQKNLDLQILRLLGQNFKDILAGNRNDLWLRVNPLDAMLIYIYMHVHAYCSPQCGYIYEWLLTPTALSC